MGQTLWWLRTRLVFYKKLWYFDKMNPQDVFYVEKCVQILYSSIHNSTNLSKVHQTYWLDGSDSDGISPLHPYYSRDYRSTSHIKRSSRRSGVFPEVQVCVSECFWGPRKVFQIYEKSWFFTTSGSKKIVHEPNPFSYTVLGSYFMKIYDVLTTWILKTYSMWEKYIQILYNAINNSNVKPAVNR